MARDNLQVQRGWDPFQELGRLQEEVNRLFDATGYGKPFLAYRERSFPLLNVYTGEKESILLAEIPGVDIGDLDITVTGSTLTLKGERKPTADVPEERYYRRERGAGQFGRLHEIQLDQRPGQLVRELAALPVVGQQRPGLVVQEGAQPAQDTPFRGG